MPGASPVGRFSRAQRLRKRSEFQAVQSLGRRVRTEHFILLLYARSADDNPALARLGVVVSKKVGNAAHRNRSKRLIREAFRATRDLWNAGVDLVVIVHTPLKAMKLADVVDEWRGATGHIRRQTTRAFEEPRRSESGGAERARRAAGPHPRAD